MSSNPSSAVNRTSRRCSMPPARQQQEEVLDEELRFTEDPNHARPRSAPPFDGEDRGRRGRGPSARAPTPKSSPSRQPQSTPSRASRSPSSRQRPSTPEIVPPPVPTLPTGRSRGRGTKEEPRVRAKDGERLRQTSIHLPVDLHKRVRKYAFDQEIALSAVMVSAIEAWLDVHEG